MTRPSHTPRILELLRAGRSPAVIAAELGVTPGRVRQVAQAHAIPLPRSPRPGRPRGPAVSLRSAGGQELLATAISLASSLGVQPQVVVLAGAWALGHGRVVIDSAGDTLDYGEAIDAEERGRTDGTSAPSDVEAAISDLVEASRDLEVYAEGKVTAKRTKSAEAEFGRARTALRTAIAAEIERGLVSARARFDCARSVFFNNMLRRRNITSPCQECEGYGVLAYPSTATWRRGAGGQMSTYDVCDRCWGSGDAVKHGVDLRRLGAEIERARAEGRGETTAAPATVARPISEWHEDRGSALWWRFPVAEPPYSGTPLNSDWPGYHTHWTPIVCPDDPQSESQAAPAPAPRGS